MLGILTAEAFNPRGYRTALHEISDHGATRDGRIYQPSSALLNVTMLATGLLVLSAFALLQQQSKATLFLLRFCLFGIGLVGVGLFSCNVQGFLDRFSLLCFTTGSVSAIVSYKIVKRPFGLLGALLGLTSLLFLFGAGHFSPVIGKGGTKRLVAYPIMGWLMGFGGLLLGGQKPWREKAAGDYAKQAAALITPKQQS